MFLLVVFFLAVEMQRTLTSTVWFHWAWAFKNSRRSCMWFEQLYSTLAGPTQFFVAVNFFFSLFSPERTAFRLLFRSCYIHVNECRFFMTWFNIFIRQIYFMRYQNIGPSKLNSFLLLSMLLFWISFSFLSLSHGTIDTSNFNWLWR